MIGSVEANWMTTSQHEMIRDFVDKRGGGVLFLGGRFGLADGGYNKEPFTDLLPVTLPARSTTYRIEPAYSELTSGRARQPDLPPHRGPRSKCSALEKASVPDELAGSGRSEARRDSCWPSPFRAAAAIASRCW